MHASHTTQRGFGVHVSTSRRPKREVVARVTAAKYGGSSAASCDDPKLVEVSETNIPRSDGTLGALLARMRRVPRPTALVLDDSDMLDDAALSPCPPQSGVRRASETLPYIAEVDETPLTDHVARELATEEDFEALPLTRRRQPTLLGVDEPRPKPSANLASGPRRIEQSKTSWQAAQTCASAVAETLGARAVLVLSLIDAESKLRVIGASGSNASDHLGETISSDDFIASAVVFNERSVVLTFDDGAPSGPARLRALGARASLIAVPIMAGGACVGVIEVVDATGHEGHAVGSVEHLARFLAPFLARSQPSHAPQAGYGVFKTWIDRAAAEAEADVEVEVELDVDP